MLIFYELKKQLEKPFAGVEVFWIDVTMWQYLFIVIAFSYLISAAFSAAVYSVCSRVSGYIGGISVCIPFGCGAILLFAFPFRWIFALPKSCAEDILILGAVVCVAVIAALVRIRKSHRERV